MPTATLSSKSQLVLPVEVRRKLGIRPGDRLIVELEGDHAVIRKAPRSDVEALAAYRSAIWRDYADEVEEARGEWDQ
ncbi:MAG: AbrB/MazE/SpoVT family DNA-binding domain-containing protein [Pseudomonadota bacterium]|nr:AbrB/MazE/SpoVT family DNA-binding domain-containing protein [Pseudomonadota bacterium]